MFGDFVLSVGNENYCLLECDAVIGFLQNIFCTSYYGGLFNFRVRRRDGTVWRKFSAGWTDATFPLTRLSRAN
jgi:hypothetical protein